MKTILPNGMLQCPYNCNSIFELSPNGTPVDIVHIGCHIAVIMWENEHFTQTTTMTTEELDFMCETITQPFQQTISI